MQSTIDWKLTKYPQFINNLIKLIHTTKLLKNSNVEVPALKTDFKCFKKGEEKKGISCGKSYASLYWSLKNLGSFHK